MIEHRKVLGNPQVPKRVFSSIYLNASGWNKISGFNHLQFLWNQWFLLTAVCKWSSISTIQFSQGKPRFIVSGLYVLLGPNWSEIFSYASMDHGAHQNLGTLTCLLTAKCHLKKFLSRTFWIEMLNIISK